MTNSDIQKIVREIGFDGEHANCAAFLLAYVATGTRIRANRLIQLTDNDTQKFYDNFRRDGLLLPNKQCDLEFMNCKEDDQRSVAFILDVMVGVGELRRKYPKEKRSASVIGPSNKRPKSRQLYLQSLVTLPNRFTSADLFKACPQVKPQTLANCLSDSVQQGTLLRTAPGHFKKSLTLAASAAA